ncbi:MAG: hypothetical protein NVS3B14_13220 [Ktedonobacteraceae bacterium]
MARNLYRFYLYAVFVAMLIFATVGLGTFLTQLLALTPLRGSYAANPGSAQLVQSGVFFGVSWLFAGLLGGLHYWLIRRDMQSNPDAGRSAIRSFFLNMTELIVAPLAIGVGANTITQLGQYSNNADLSSPIAITIASLALVGVLELERQRAKAGVGVPVFFQRLHLYGVQFILLNVLIGYWMFSLDQVVDALVFGGSGSGTPPCGGFVVCQGQNILSNVAAMLWVALFWAIYGFAGRSDSLSLLRRIAHYISFAYGAGFVLYGLYQLIELAILHIAGVRISPSDFLNTYNFISSILLGLLIAGVYALWLRSATLQNPAEWLTSVLIGEAIIAVLMAAAFYTGTVLLLLNLSELPVSANAWAMSLSLLITGAGYIALDMRLRWRKRADVPGALNAWRGFVFVLLGSGILAGAIGGAFALYSLISAVLGSPLGNWQHIARTGASVFGVSALIVGLYFWLANREKLFAGLGKRTVKGAPPVAPTPVTELKEPVPVAEQTSPAPVATGIHLTIEEVLDELLAGKISRNEAATRIRDIAEVK